MHIIVCVKQVPNTQAITIDPVTHTLVREGVESIVNPYDAYALEAAARLQDKDAGIKIHVLTMGPPQAEAVLRECLSLSADAAWLVTDRHFGGSDTLATSYVLSEAIKKIETEEGIKFDMVFCGKQAIDGDTAQVGPQIAERLDLPQITHGLTCELVESELHVLRETDEGKEIVAVLLPCLVTFTKPDFEPRFPSVKRRSAARKMNIRAFGIDDFPDIDRLQVGLKGSPTQVKRTFVPELKAKGTIFRDMEEQDAARQLARLLVENEIIIKRGSSPTLT